jgi:RimJ/RimL family protein N-acetyltransferase
MQLDPTPRWTDGRIRLFPLTPESVTDAYVGWLADPEINRFLESRFSEQDRASVEAFVSGVNASPKDVVFGIHDVELGRHVGNIKLGPIDHNHGAGEIGIMIGDRAAWGRGVGTAAIAILVSIAREELGLRKLTAGCYVSNVGSRKAFEKAGFSVEGVRLAQCLIDGEPEDVILLGRLV